MSYNHGSAISIITLILLAAGSPVSTGQSIGVSVTGRLCCTLTGKCPIFLNSPGILGAVACMDCTAIDGVIRTAVRVGQNTTDANGQFTITVAGTNSSGVVFNLFIIPCLVTFELPINSTVRNSALATSTGFLVSLVNPLTLTSIVPRLSFGRVRNATIVSFVRFSSIPSLF